MGFVKKNISSEQNFGKDLRELRELRGWSVKQLADTSGIPEHLIKAFEQENFAILDNPYYHERHVKTLIYALDGRAPFFIGKYRAALKRDGFDPKQRNKDYSFTKKTKHSEFFTTTKYLPFLLLIPIFLFLIYYVYNEAKIFNQAPPLQLDSPQNYAKFKTPNVTISGITDPNASITVNGQEAVVQNDGRFSISLDIPRGLTKLTVTAKKRYGLVRSLIRYVTYTPVQGPSPPKETIYFNQAFTATSTTTTTATSSDQ